MAKPTGKKEYQNRTVAAFFENEKFGEGSLKSTPLNDEGMKVLANTGIGFSFVLKRAKRKDGSPVLSKEGNQTYFLEVLPPYQPKNSSADL